MVRPPTKPLTAVLAAGAMAAAGGCAIDLPAAGAPPVEAVERAAPSELAEAAPPEVDLATWDTAELSTGWRAEELFGAVVHGPDGAKIGNVVNLVVGPDGMIQAAIVEAEGALDIGATHLRVPWERVQLGPDLRSATAPVTNENVQDYSLFRDFQAREPRAFRATELIGDYVALEDEPAYAIVDDLVFSREGELKAVVVSPDAGFARDHGYAYGDYALPYYGYDYGFDPGLDFFELPYRAGDIGAVKRFNLPMMGD